MGKPLHHYEFIIIDDDTYMANVQRINLTKVFKFCDIRVFIDPTKGFDFLKNTLHMPEGPWKRVVFLDLYMPVIDGFAILDSIMKLKPEKEKIDVYIVSGSHQENDIQKAANYDIVNGFIPKPMTIDRISEIFGEKTKPKNKWAWWR